MNYYEQLKTLYDHHMIFKSGLRKAVKDGRITSDQYKEITHEEY